LIELRTDDLPRLESTSRDIRAACRYFRHNRAFFITAVVTLAFGIGATTAVFSVAETLLLRPLPYPDSERLVTLRNIDTVSDYPSTRVAPGLLAEWQRTATSFEAIAGYRWASVDVVSDAQSDRLNGLLATPEFFEVFGVPLIGRPFDASDRGAKRQFETTDTGEVVVLGDEVWRRHFARAGARVGSAVDLHVLNFARVGPTGYTVTGRAAEPVAFPPLQSDSQIGDSEVTDTVDFWMPQFVSTTQVGEPGPRDFWFDVVARLRPGITLAQAQAEMDAIARTHMEAHPDTSRGSEVRVVPLREHVAGDVQASIALLGVGTAMLLLIACSNVATLLLAKGVSRRREVAIRMALGGRRSTIVRQFFIEALIVAGCAGLVGALLAGWAIHFARPWMPHGLPLLREMGLNATVLTFTLLSSALTACLTGVVPAMRVSRAAGARLIGLGGNGIGPDRAQSRLVGGLVAAEVALTILLLISAALFVRSAFRVSRVATGFNAGQLLTMTISLPANKFDWDYNARFSREVLKQVRSLSSVRDAAVVHGVPMGAGSHVSTGGGTVEGYESTSDDEQLTYGIRIVSPGYFATMQIPILAGRAFDARDEQGERGQTPSFLVSHSFATRYWGGKSPLGKRISFGDSHMTVVGVVGDVRYSGLEAEPTVEMYLPQGRFPQSAITLVARTRSDPLGAAPAIRERIRGVDPHAFVTDVRSMDQLVSGSQAERRAGTLLVLCFAVLAMVLVAAGTYGVVSQAVASRRVELAIRSALGAGPRRLVALAMRTAFRPAVIGVALGGLGALTFTRVIESLLFGVSALDVMSWVGASATVVAGCAAAGYLSGRRAARVDPIEALKSD